MKTLDRYIIRLFVINFVILLVVMMILFVLIDVIIDLDEILRAGQTWVKAGVFSSEIMATLWVIWDFHYPMMLLILVYLAGLLVVGATAFTLSGLSKTGELVAMVTSGISMYRIAAPILVCGCLISALMLPLQEYVIPKLAPKLIRSKTQMQYGKLQTIGIGYARDGNNNLLSAAEFKYDGVDSVLGRVSILVRNKQGIPQRRITADQAVWNQKKGGWDLVGGHSQPLDRTGLVVGYVGEGSRVETFFKTSLTPEVLQAHRASDYLSMLSFRELRQLSKNPAMDGKALQQIIHSRISLVVLNVLVLVMSLPFFLRREPGGSIVYGLMAAGVSMATFFGGFMLMQVGFEHFNPLAAAWLPVVIFLPISAAVLQMTKT